MPLDMLPQGQVIMRQNGDHKDKRSSVEDMELVVWGSASGAFASAIARKAIFSRDEFSFVDYVLLFFCLSLALLVGGILGTLVVRKYNSWVSTFVACLIAGISTCSRTHPFWFTNTYDNNTSNKAVLAKMGSVALVIDIVYLTAPCRSHEIDTMHTTLGAGFISELAPARRA